MSDNETTINELKQAIKKFRDDRDWQKYHTPKNLAESISIEAAELLEKFQWKSEEEIDELLNDPTYKSEVKEELADVFNYCLALSIALDIDLSEALLEKVKLNSEKYPVEKSKGEYKKYSKL
ncbi:nucleotide pyrophosphohydrolase [Candidatus Pacearchaeota archaeon]|nr:nucleotide pyrophosphohydrolase [Candidatus Pacearchaeota archaeon]